MPIDPGDTRKTRLLGWAAVSLLLIVLATIQGVGSRAAVGQGREIAGRWSGRMLVDYRSGRNELVPIEVSLTQHRTELTGQWRIAQSSRYSASGTVSGTIQYVSGVRRVDLQFAYDGAVPSRDLRTSPSRTCVGVGRATGQFTIANVSGSSEPARGVIRVKAFEGIAFGSPCDPVPYAEWELSRSSEPGLSREKK